jgi:hypothetical protein
VTAAVVADDSITRAEGRHLWVPHPEVGPQGVEKRDGGSLVGPFYMAVEANVLYFDECHAVSGDGSTTSRKPATADEMNASALPR